MRTEATLASICTSLQRNCGDQYEACRENGVSLIFLDQWCRDDAKVAERVAEAVRVGTMGLVSAAIKRGVHGVEEDVYYRGIVVGQKTNYSDTLLTTLLKAKVPEFHKDSDGGGVQVNVNVANIMPRADTYEQWLAMKDRTDKAAIPKQAALSAAIDAVFEEVPSERDKSLEAIGRIMTQPAPGLRDLL
jgi:hypothetical protein